MPIGTARGDTSASAIGSDSFVFPTRMHPHPQHLCPPSVADVSTLASSGAPTDIHDPRRVGGGVGRRARSVRRVSCDRRIRANNNWSVMHRSVADKDRSVWPGWLAQGRRGHEHPRGFLQIGLLHVPVQHGVGLHRGPHRGAPPPVISLHVRRACVRACLPVCAQGGNHSFGGAAPCHDDESASRCNRRA